MKVDRIIQDWRPPEVHHPNDRRSSSSSVWIKRSLLFRSSSVTCPVDCAVMIVKEVPSGMTSSDLLTPRVSYCQLANRTVSGPKSEMLKYYGRSARSNLKRCVKCLCFINWTTSSLYRISVQMMICFSFFRLASTSKPSPSFMTARDSVWNICGNPLLRCTARCVILVYYYLKLVTDY